MTEQTQVRGRRRAARPPVTWLDRERAVDLGFLLGLCLLALLGLGPSFAGAGFAIAGLLGLVVSIGIGQAAWAKRLPAIAAVVMVLIAFVMLGGPVALRSLGATAYLPLPGTVLALLDEVVFGWKDLLTTLPPVDGGGTLLVLPWLLGLVAGTVGVLLLRFRHPALPLLAPLGLLVVVILLGVARPASIWLQGATFATIAFAWLALRHRRGVSGRSVDTPTAVRVRRGGAAAVLLAVAAGLAVPLSAAVGDDDRVVLRDHVEPPFEVGDYSSPLASFRRYVEMEEPDPSNLWDTELFTVTGASAGARVRIATLDRYDGVVYGAGDSAGFQRVSSVIDNPVPGDRVEVSIEVGPGWNDVWLPTVGALQSMNFEQGEPRVKAESFRYNLNTATAVVPTGVREGDVYSFGAVIDERELQPEDLGYGPPEARESAEFLETQAVQWSAGHSEPMARVFAIAEYMRRDGHYSDGVLESERIYLAGHHRHRLTDGQGGVNSVFLVGNDEQYAAWMALLATRVGVPARVVMGAVLPEDGVVRGEHVQAWVEVRIADGRWVTLPRERYMGTSQPGELPPQQSTQVSGVNVPPPAPIPPPSALMDQADAELNARRQRRDADLDEPFLAGWPTWLKVTLVSTGAPILLLGAAMGLVVLLKRIRRRRRRTAARMTARVIGGWRELVDLAVDLGVAVPGRATRREQALVLPTAAAGELARRADAHVFGPEVPPDWVVDDYWQHVLTEHQAMTAGLTRRRRFVAAVHPRSLWG
ncbi:transglutaminase-like domain-containing protein [Nocardioides limicola]|uniref:transglutaminase-like domain-containing protein n=1 Tax=Nocardioides limicola TaxID=2803368 RepID=UPI00193C5F21|nr:transglutaminase-like domain-containing protein [Nocardioides sp. DJM-14]